MEHIKTAEHDQRLQVMLRSHVERCLQEIWDQRELATDPDQDYPYRYGTAMCWVSLVDGPVPGVRVFAHAARELRSSAKLLREVNELNMRSRWAKVAYHGGIVQVVAELHWAGVDRLALEQVIGSVGEVAADIGSLFATVYGGATPFPPELEQQDQNADEKAA